MSVEARIYDLDVNNRVEKAIRCAMENYMNKLSCAYIEVGLENAFQMHLAEIISKELEQNTFFTDERFVVKFEKNMPINGNNDYVDIVIEYSRGIIKKLYLIELKFKKVSDSAPDLGNIESYKDIYNLDCHKNTSNVEDCYFIFLTNNSTYLNKSSRGTRTEIPMYDGYTIKKDTKYIVTGNSAKKNTEKYPNGFVFSNNYEIQYEHINMPNVNTTKKDYWFFIIKI